MGDAVLISRQAFIGAGAAAAGAPGRLVCRIWIAGVSRREGSAADRENVGRGTRPNLSRAVAGRRRVSDAGRGEIAVVEGFRAEFPAAPAHGDGHHAGLTVSIAHPAEQVAQTIGARLHEKDVGPRGDGMSPFHVERDFARPVGVGSGLSLGSGLREEAAGGPSRNAERVIENVQVLEDVRIIVRIDDGNGLSGAVATDLDFRNLAFRALKPDECIDGGKGLRSKTKCDERNNAHHPDTNAFGCIHCFFEINKRYNNYLVKIT